MEKWDRDWRVRRLQFIKCSSGKLHTGLYICITLSAHNWSNDKVELLCIEPSPFSMNFWPRWAQALFPSLLVVRRFHWPVCPETCPEAILSCEYRWFEQMRRCGACLFEGLVSWLRPLLYCEQGNSVRKLLRVHWPNDIFLLFTKQVMGRASHLSIWARSSGIFRHGRYVPM